MYARDVYMVYTWLFCAMCACIHEIMAVLRYARAWLGLRGLMGIMAASAILPERDERLEKENKA